ncbi:hypothetical protein R6242_09735 [Iodobacter sp. CM08]|uniref:hypothetical protein n=1 Tax=Iodobacter sp. CM08 TaxID=3085902 RepID=UPI002982680A|nr:hypothetical protein [Iodobacter sp. CM08]MDW5416844.1 hypothetical protein [Iodobacter sp. CM08]
MMEEHSQNKSPADLFLCLFAKAEGMTAHQRRTVVKDATFKPSIENALRKNSGDDAFTAVEGLLSKGGGLPAEVNGRILMAMQAIDEFFYLINPRAQFVPLAKPAHKLPDWLRDLRDARRISGRYAQNERFNLVPRGPLLRRDRDENASNAESLLDRFTALTPVPITLSIDTRKINVEYVVIGLGAIDGVVAGKKTGHEKVVFIPLAEKKADLVLSERTISEQPYVDFFLSPSLNAANIIHEVLKNTGPVDIAFAPELVTKEEHADNLAALLNASPVLSRMIIAGSGQTRALCPEGLAWNEARIFNGKGSELWRQRKLWPAGLAAERAKEYGLDCPDGKLAMEDNAEGDTVVIADLDGLGRCVVLICQDIQAKPMTADLIDRFQPDWVFIPVLDPGVQEGRWGHQRCFELSEASNTRFMIASSTALADRLGWKDPVACGLAIGPKAPSADGDQGRVCKEAEILAGTAPGYAKIEWRSDGWKKSTLSANK